VSYIFIDCFACLGIMCATALVDVVGVQNFPCLLQFLLFHLCIPLTAMAKILKLQRYSIHTTSVRVANLRKANSPLLSTSTNGKASWKTFRAFFTVLFRGRRRATVEERQLALKFMKSSAYTLFALVTAYVGSLIGISVRLATDPNLTGGCTGCQLTTTDVAIEMVVVFFGMAFNLLTLPFKVLKQDTLRMLREVVELWHAAWLYHVGFVLFFAIQNDTFNLLVLINLFSYLTIYLQTWKLIFLARRMKQRMFIHGPTTNRQEVFRETMCDFFSFPFNSTKLTH
jgi:hypothetical protein